MEHWISQTEDFVRQALPVDATGHDWQHVFRVRRNAVAIARAEQADLLVVELAALLHDIADHKFHQGNEHAGHQAARQWLEKLEVPEPIIEQVCQIIARLSFKGADVVQEPLSLAGQIVQDADRLDALGAIGIARAFAYGGYKDRPMFDPEVPPERHATFEAYKKSAGPTLNHFYEKLFKVRKQLNTKTAKSIALKREKFMKAFLKEFYAEWDGKA